MIQELFTFITQRWDFLLPLIYEHLQISAIAIVFATIVGVSIGILIAEKRKASSLTLGIISFLYTIPSISMLGFLIPVTGIGNTSAIIALSIYALLPIIVAPILVSPVWKRIFWRLPAVWEVPLHRFSGALSFRLPCRLYYPALKIWW